MGKQLVTVVKKNSFLTGINLKKNQALGAIYHNCLGVRGHTPGFAILNIGAPLHVCKGSLSEAQMTAVSNSELFIIV